MAEGKLPREIITEAVETKLNSISTANGYQTNYSEIKHADQIPTEYGYNGLYWRDGKAEGEFGKNQQTKLWIEVDGILVETQDKPAYSWGTLALADLEKAFKTIGVGGAVSTKWKSDKWVETRGKTVARVYFAVCVAYHNRLR